jgi:hypothetical protein
MKVWFPAPPIHSSPRHSHQISLEKLIAQFSQLKGVKGAAWLGVVCTEQGWKTGFDLIACSQELYATRP